MRTTIWRMNVLCLCLTVACAPATTPDAPTAQPTSPPPESATLTFIPSATPRPSETPTAASLIPTATQTTKAHPGPRAVGDMVFHEGLGMVVMLNGSRTDDRLWGWDGTQWQLIAEGGPKGLALGGAVYDPQRDKLVVYGGYSLTTNQCQSDTWEWDAQGWQQLEVTSSLSERQG